jgi:hypothetical protein
VEALHEKLSTVHAVVHAEARVEALEIRARLDAKAQELASAEQLFNEQIAALRAELAAEAGAKEGVLAQMASLQAVRLDEAAQTQARLSACISALNVARAAGKNGGYYFSAAAAEQRNASDTRFDHHTTPRERRSTGSPRTGSPRRSVSPELTIMSPGRGGSLSPTYFLTAAAMSGVSVLSGRVASPPVTPHGRSRPGTPHATGAPGASAQPQSQRRVLKLSSEPLDAAGGASGGGDDRSAGGRFNSSGGGVEDGTISGTSEVPVPPDGMAARITATAALPVVGEPKRPQQEEQELQRQKQQQQQQQQPPSPPSPKKGTHAASPATKKSGARKPLAVAGVPAGHSSPLGSRRLMSDRGPMSKRGR